MSWRLVARHDARDLARSRLGWLLPALTVAGLGGVVVAYPVVAARPAADTSLVYLATLARWLVPAAALVTGYGAVVRHREAGRLALLLGLSLDRRAVAAGALVSRTGAVAAATAAGLAVAGLATAVRYAAWSPRQFLAVGALTVLLGVAVGALAVGVSLASGSAARAVTVLVGAFVCFLFAWDLLPAGLYFVAFGSFPGNDVPPDWYLLLSRLNPANAYTAAVTAALPTLKTGLGAARPAYLTGWFAVAVLVGWSVLAPLAGYVRFARAELG
ncbi:MAG: ABC transporter permease subunit [Halobacteriaceae archaeon]